MEKKTGCCQNKFAWLQHETLPCPRRSREAPPQNPRRCPLDDDEGTPATASQTPPGPRPGWRPQRPASRSRNPARRRPLPARGRIAPCALGSPRRGPEARVGSRSPTTAGRLRMARPSCQWSGSNPWRSRATGNRPRPEPQCERARRSPEGRRRPPCHGTSLTDPVRGTAGATPPSQRQASRRSPHLRSRASRTPPRCGSILASSQSRGRSVHTRPRRGAGPPAARSAGRPASGEHPRRCTSRRALAVALRNLLPNSCRVGR
mmetsp:Transcript_16163/g.56429  ORF Transcript_16163/g.56429 Transcript_16163/m.56429 type:complete len:262 (-) Transcript_16163:1957-2742(-)